MCRPSDVLYCSARRWELICHPLALSPAAVRGPWMDLRKAHARWRKFMNQNVKSKVVVIELLGSLSLDLAEFLYDRTGWKGLPHLHLLVWRLWNYFFLLLFYCIAQKRLTFYWHIHIMQESFGTVGWESHGFSCHSSEPPEEAQKPQPWTAIFTFPSWGWGRLYQIPFVQTGQLIQQWLLPCHFWMAQYPCSLLNEKTSSLDA